MATVGGDELQVEQILLAPGRAPNVEELGLDRAGIEHGRGGIVVDDRLRTSADGVWAAGDVADGHQFTPVAQYEARIAVDDMFGSKEVRADYDWLPTAIFTDPELAAVGLTEQKMGATVDDLAHMHHAVPTWGEGVKAAAEQALIAESLTTFSDRIEPGGASRRAPRGSCTSFSI